MAKPGPSEDAWHAIAAAIAKSIDAPLQIENPSRVAGGCINNAYLIQGGGQRLFVKTNGAHCAPMFEAEADALVRLAATGAIRVPKPAGTGIAGGQAWLALEFLDLGSPDPDWSRLGRELAGLHRHDCDRFGWHRDNSLGTTAAGYRGKLQDQGGQLLERLERFFDDYQPLPSLLHGDLWLGNAGFMTDGTPVVFDPACHYGDREADLAMTELFGEFPPDFYRGYDEAWPLDPGYRLRKRLYRLYHLLNHLNLFGADYLEQCEQELGALLSQAARRRSC